MIQLKPSLVMLNVPSASMGKLVSAASSPKIASRDSFHRLINLYGDPEVFFTMT